MSGFAFDFTGTGSVGIALGEVVPARSDNVVPVQCPLQEMKLQKNTADLLPKLKAMALGDRAVFESKKEETVASGFKEAQKRRERDHLLGPHFLPL